MTSDGEKDWRYRDDEFADGCWTRVDIERAWAAGFDVVDREIGKLADADLAKTVTIRGVGLTVHEALCRSIAHTASHTGQIVLLAKIAAGASWQTLTISKNGSAAYNQNPIKEKAPLR